MQPHAGVQVVIVGLAGHVGHGEVYCRTVGDGHCRGHRENKERWLCFTVITAKKDFNVSTVVRLSTVSFPNLASRDAQLIAK